MNEFIEYMKIHLISLHQDADGLQNLMDNFKGDYDSDSYRDMEIEDMVNTGEIRATNHLLSVAEGMINS
jgi:hypothetical protein